MMQERCQEMRVEALATKNREILIPTFQFLNDTSFQRSPALLDIWFRLRNQLRREIVFFDYLSDLLVVGLVEVRVIRPQPKKRNKPIIKLRLEHLFQYILSFGTTSPPTPNQSRRGSPYTAGHTRRHGPRKRSGLGRSLQSKSSDKYYMLPSMFPTS